MRENPDTSESKSPAAEGEAAAAAQPGILLYIIWEGYFNFLTGFFLSWVYIVFFCDVALMGVFHWVEAIILLNLSTYLVIEAAFF